MLFGITYVVVKTTLLYQKKWVAKIILVFLSLLMQNSFFGIHRCVGTPHSFRIKSGVESSKLIR